MGVSMLRSASLLLALLAVFFAQPVGAQLFLGQGSAVKTVGGALPACTATMESSYIIVDPTSASACTGGAVNLYDDANYCYCDQDDLLWRVLASTLAAGAGGAVDSFNARTGAVVPVSGDYNVAQVTGAAASSTLGSTGAGQGASLIGVEDAGGLLVATEVEAALAELKGLIDAVAAGSGHANGANAPAGQAIVGVDENGVAEGAFDVQTQVEADAHVALPNAHHVPTVDTNTNAETECVGVGVYLDGEGNCSTPSGSSLWTDGVDLTSLSDETDEDLAVGGSTNGSGVMYWDDSEGRLHADGFTARPGVDGANFIEFDDNGVTAPALPSDLLVRLYTLGDGELYKRDATDTLLGFRLLTDQATAGAGSGVLADCDLASDKLSYDITTGLLSCTTDDDVPESGDFGAAVDLDATGALNFDVETDAEATAHESNASAHHAPTTDTNTNAETECVGVGVYLDGEGNCSTPSGSSLWTDGVDLTSLTDIAGEDLAVGGTTNVPGVLYWDDSTALLYADGFVSRPGADGDNRIELDDNGTTEPAVPSGLNVSVYTKNDGEVYKRDATDSLSGFRFLTSQATAGAGSGTLADCDLAADKLLYDSATGLLSCGADQSSVFTPDADPAVNHTGFNAAVLSVETDDQDATEVPILGEENLWWTPGSVDSAMREMALYFEYMYVAPIVTTGYTVGFSSESRIGSLTVDVLTSGSLRGGVDVVTTAGTTLTPAADNILGSFHVLTNVALVTVTLPNAIPNRSVCFYDLDGTAGVTIDLNDVSDIIVLDGNPLTAGNAIDSPGNAGDFICFLAIDTTNWITLGRSGAWVDGGAS